MNLFKQIFSKPIVQELLVSSSHGFHLRPVAKFVCVAKTFSCDITATFNNKQVSAKAVNALLSLGLDKGDTFNLAAKGKDAKLALDTLKETFLTLMQSDEDSQNKADEEKKQVQKKINALSNNTYNYMGDCLYGESIYAGIAVAALHHLVTQEHYSQNNATFQGAIVEAVAHLTRLAHNNKQSDIYLAQKELLLALSSQVRDVEALSLLIYKEIETLKGGKLESKAVDYLDLLRLVKSNLGYSYHSDLPKKPFILLADDLLPSNITELEQSAVQGVILQASSPTSHTAILLSAAGIPSLILTKVSAETFENASREIILDTYRGIVVSHPNREDIQYAKETQTVKKDEEALRYKKRFNPAQTTDNKKIQVYANVTDVNAAKLAKEEGAEGIGLLRTEFLFTEQKPKLELQTQAYKEIFDLFSDVTVRTLDVGGDKSLPYVNLPKEENPFLGIRGIRLLQTHPGLISEQLKAIFLAAKNKPIKVMFPMISSVDEFTQAKAFALNVAKADNIAIDNILFGMMIEVPSVLFSLREFDKVVDFYSVGTNDLTQYLFAIERTHPTLKIDVLSPVVFTVLETIVDSVTKPVSICGELASNTDAIPKLIQMGYKNLSVTPKSIAQTKETIRHSE